MIYKKYEFSLSLNGENVIHIARNASGIVVFRAASEKELRAMIDNSIHEAEQQAAKDAKEKAESEKKQIQKKKGHQNNEGPDSPEQTTEALEVTEEKEEESILTPPQTRVTRGPDGKFISKSQLEKEEPQKKGFWEKLTS